MLGLLIKGPAIEGSVYTVNDGPGKERLGGQLDQLDSLTPKKAGVWNQILEFSSRLCYQLGD